MKNTEFKTKQFKDATVYTLESASSGGTSAGSIASVNSPMGGVRKRGDNLIAQEANTDKVDPSKPRNFVAKNAKMGGAGAHKDKKKAEKQGDVKHKSKPVEIDEGNENPYGYEIGQTVKLSNGTQGRVIDIFDDSIEVLLPGGRTMTVDFRDAEVLGENGMSEDHEIQMASSELQSIAKNAVNLLDLVRKYSEQDGLQAWQQSKITKAADYLNSVLQSVSGEQSAVEGYGRYDRRDAYQRDQDNAEYGMDKHQSRAYRADGGGNDERHDLDPTEWYIVKDGKMFKTSVYPNQVQLAIAQGYSRTRDEAKAKAGEQGVAEGKEDKIAQLKKDHDTAVHWSKNETSPQKREAARQKAEKIKRHLDTQYKQGVAEGLPQTLRKVVPGYAKREIDKKMDAGKFGKTDADKDANFQRYKKIQDKIKEEGEKTMSRAAKGNEKYGKDGMKALAKAGREGASEKKLDAIRDKHDNYNEGLDDPKDNPCWKGYKPVGTKKKAGKTVPNCVPKESAAESRSILKGIKESINKDELINAVYDALIQNYGDVVQRYGHEVVGDNIIKVVNSYGNTANGFDEIDMMTHDVMNNLKGVNDADMDEDHSDMGKGFGKNGYYTAQAQKIHPDGGNVPVAEDEYMAELFNKLSEKIPANAPVDVWIKDFQKANPNKYHQFKNKTPEKKAQMAVAASYGAKNPSKKK